MNYRSKLWRWEPELPPRELATRTMRELLSFADLFVGGREDAEAILGVGGSVPLDELARQVAQQFPRLSRVAMTVREGISATHNNFGGLLFDKVADQLCRAPENGKLYPITHIVDRLGAGDAFTAGLIYALTTPKLTAPPTALAFATAAGCLAHSIEGDFNFSTRGEIEALMSGNSAGRVNR
jgi:2-dehydro-3-deoxygluconokinase